MVELTAPSGEMWTFGDPNAVDRVKRHGHRLLPRGYAATPHLADTALKVEGPAATAWMEIAQAFAGPPGQGREAGGVRGGETVSDELVHLEIANGVATVTLDSTENRNALSKRLLADLERLMDAAIADPRSRIVVLTGAGTVFCSGADLKEQRAANAAGEPTGPGGLVPTLTRMWHSPKADPWADQWRRAGRGGRIGLVAACDIAVGVETATFAVSEVRVGVIPAIVRCCCVPKLGEAKCMELFLTGEPMGRPKRCASGCSTRVQRPRSLTRPCSATWKAFSKAHPAPRRMRSGSCGRSLACRWRRRSRR